MQLATETQKPIDKFLAIHLESLRINAILDFDLYILKGKEPILYRASSLPFTEQNRTNLLDSNIRRLYVPIDKLPQYQKYIESNLPKIIIDPSIDETSKAGIVYDSAKLLVNDVFSKPMLGRNIKRSQAMVETTVSFILKGQNAFYNLLRMMSFDYHIYTHSVNVCTFSLALAQFIGISDANDLKDLGTGALLHDVGKTRISESILKKQGALSKKEMDLIRKHPEWGYEIIKETDLIAQKSYYPIIQHHERENKSGYPHQLSGNNIHLYSKIVAIADVFDAMTTQRIYRNAIDSFSALKTMRTDKDAFDKILLNQFIKLMGPVGAATA